MKFHLFKCTLPLLLASTANALLITPALANCPLDAAIYSANQQRLTLPVVSVDGGLAYNAQLDVLNSQSPFHFQLTSATQASNLASIANYQTSEQLLSIRSLCLPSEASPLGYQVQMQAIPNSMPLQFLLKSVSDSNGMPIFNWAIEQNKGALLLPDRSAFERLAAKSDVSGASGVQELKFVIVDLDSSHPVLFFMNSQATPLHYDFVREVLNRYQNINYDQGATQFINETYFRNNRHHIAGSIVAYDHFSESENTQTSGLYALEFWPTDPVPANLIAQVYHTVSAAMPFLSTPLAYHPVGNTHELEYATFAEQFAAQHIRTIHTDSLFAQLDSAILNKGEAYGRLKVINPGDPNPSEDVIAIYTFIPNTLGHVGGIITEEPQTPLSHINLKARQNNTPNAYMRHVHSNPAISPLIDSWVHYVVNDDGVHLESATEAESLQWLADRIPSEMTIPASDLSATEPMPLSTLTHNDWIRVGVKAANVAELGRILPEGVPPTGYALPFAMYDEFMRLKRCADDLKSLCNTSDGLSFYDYIEQLLNDESFNQDNQIRTEKLTELRKLIEQAEVPDTLIERIEAVRLFWEPAGEPFTQKLRVRSSTNNEDLPGFNGAGLYDSNTHKPSEGKLIKSIKEVWASLWNERAFNERRLHRIDHLRTYMGILINPSYGDEQANGVAISKNIYNPNWEGFYINAQYGELSITNPEPVNTANGLVNPIPDEFIVTRLPASTNGFAWETLFIRHSNINEINDAPVKTKNVLTDSEINELRDNLQIIHAHFKKIYQGDDTFAMDIEFKITETDDDSRGRLAIKQARPWID
ncbi:MAG: PEP/pyruvate-binding domain-containing protein [Methylococcaceae bacterium]|nr:PEP/pyruvate-binding domain-containing protein [Methylococcaceae bacterium]